MPRARGIIEAPWSPSHHHQVKLSRVLSYARFIGRLKGTRASHSTFYFYSSPSHNALAMSSRLTTTSASTSLSTLTESIQPHDLHPSSHRDSSKAWVDPASLPNHHHASFIGGNTPDYVKQLNYNTFMCYGVGEEDCFGYKVGKAVKFTEVNVNRKLERQGRLEATTIAELEVTKREYSFFSSSSRVGL